MLRVMVLGLLGVTVLGGLGDTGSIEDAGRFWGILGVTVLGSIGVYWEVPRDTGGYWEYWAYWEVLGDTVSNRTGGTGHYWGVLGTLRILGIKELGALGDTGCYWEHWGTLNVTGCGVRGS